MWYACKISVILNPFRVQSLTARRLFASKMPKFSSLADYSDYFIKRFEAGESFDYGKWGIAVCGA